MRVEYREAAEDVHKNRCATRSRGQWKSMPTVACRRLAVERDSFSLRQGGVRGVVTNECEVVMSKRKE